MLHWIGGCVAATACAALGFGIAALLNTRVKALAMSLLALRQLSRRIELLHEPMNDAMYALRAEAPLFMLACDSGEENPETAIRYAVERTRGLQTGDAAIIAETIRNSCSASLDEQTRIYAAGIDLLSSHEEAARRKAASDAKLYRTLGLLAGAVILILLL